eukprot:807098-Rhodomonas_salina.4
MSFTLYLPSWIRRCATHRPTLEEAPTTTTFDPGSICALHRAAREERVPDAMRDTSGLMPENAMHVSAPSARSTSATSPCIFGVDLAWG